MPCGIVALEASHIWPNSSQPTQPEKQIKINNCQTSNARFSQIFLRRTYGSIEWWFLTMVSHDPWPAKTVLNNTVENHRGLTLIGNRWRGCETRKPTSATSKMKGAQGRPKKAGRCLKLDVSKLRRIKVAVLAHGILAGQFFEHKTTLSLEGVNQLLAKQIALAPALTETVAVEPCLSAPKAPSVLCFAPRWAGAPIWQKYEGYMDLIYMGNLYGNSGKTMRSKANVAKIIISDPKVGTKAYGLTPAGGMIVQYKLMHSII